MSTDLNVLLAAARAAYPDAMAAEVAFMAEIKYRAGQGDLLCYGLWVHHNQAPVLRNLAYSRHAHLIASTMEASSQTLIVCPPEHGKSALMRWEMEMWLGVETERCYADPAHTVPSAALVMNTASQVEKQIMEIQRTIERNPRFKELFPHVRPDKTSGWTKDHFFLQRPALRSRTDPTLQGTGMFGPLQGGRVGKATVDDPTDQQDARSPSLLKAQSEWLAGTLDDRVMRHGTKRYILTRWSEKDTFSTLSKDAGGSVLVMPAYPSTSEPDPLGRKPKEPLWPEEWPADRLEEKRQSLIDKGFAYLWQMTYLCSPQVATGTVFQRRWFSYGIPSNILTPMAS